MTEKLSESQVRGILQSIENALEKGPWEESNFLRAIGKNIRDMRDSLAQEIEETYTGSANALSKKVFEAHRAETLKEVFIALYSSDGIHLNSWERIIFNLPKQTIARPIYDDEESVRTFIKSKENKFNEAYVALYIDEKDILKLSTDKISLDRFGKPLIALKDRAVHLENIKYFSKFYYIFFTIFHHILLLIFRKP